MDLTTQIKTALKKAGLDEGLAEKIKVTEESQIDAEIKKLKGKIELTSEQLVEAIKEAGLEESFNKHLQSETDRRVSQAITTHDLKSAKEKEEAATKEKAEKKKKEEQANMNEGEKKISDLTEEVKNLTTLVKDLSGTTVKTKRETLIKDALKKADLSEGFSKYITVEKDEDIEGSVKSLKDEVLGLKQAEIDKKLKDEEVPPKGEATGNLEEELIGKIASGKEGTAGTFEGKKLIEEEKNN
ncbi:hypothetical protein ES708_05623 [subsurface metagenome]